MPWPCRPTRCSISTRSRSLFFFSFFFCPRIHSRPRMVLTSAPHHITPRHAGLGIVSAAQRVCRPVSVAANAFPVRGQEPGGHRARRCARRLPRRRPAARVAQGRRAVRMAHSSLCVFLPYSIVCLVCVCVSCVVRRYIFHLLSDGRTVNDIQLTKAGSSVITSSVRALGLAYAHTARRRD